MGNIYFIIDTLDLRGMATPAIPQAQLKAPVTALHELARRSMVFSSVCLHEILLCFDRLM